MLSAGRNTETLRRGQRLQLDIIHTRR